MKPRFPYSALVHNVVLNVIQPRTNVPPDRVPAFGYQ